MHEAVLLLTFMRVQRMWIGAKRQNTACPAQSAYTGEARDRHGAKHSGGCMADLAKVLKKWLKKLKTGLSAKNFERRKVYQNGW